MHKLQLTMLPGEYWYGGHTNYGYLMPVNAKKVMLVDTTVVRSYGQANTLFVSNKGRVIWSEAGFKTRFVFGRITCTGRKAKIGLYQADDHTLRGAYHYAVDHFMPPDGTYPDELMFRIPQYCTWIQFEHNQTQQGIVDYAKSILDCGMPAGELIIDDGWQRSFGDWRFDPAKFADAKKMTDELHTLGFKVILWIAPFVSDQAADFQKLKDENLLVLDKNGRPARRKWWNGADYLLDFSNPAAQDWFFACTRYLTDELGIDGFKQDAGDAMYYRDDDRTYGGVDANGQSKLWALSARHYRFNELRACFQCGGMGVAQRLADKSHRWNFLGLGALLPNVLIQGLSGYPYSCPDMIGGGEWTAFVYGKHDEELFIRMAEASALFPMMQFSSLPWRHLSPKAVQVCKEMAELHEQMYPEIEQALEETEHTGEPMIRSMEYAYPGCGYERINDQFLLGENILVAPVVEKGARARRVIFPQGVWQNEAGRRYEGPIEAVLEAPLEKLLWFRRA